MKLPKAYLAAALSVLLLLPPAAHAADLAGGASDLSDYLHGDSSAVYTLPAGTTTLEGRIVLPGGIDKYLHLPAGSDLVIAGSLELPAGAALALTGAGEMRLSGGITNAGRLLVDCGAALSGGSGIANRGFLEVGPAGHFTVGPAAASPGIANDGRIEIYGLMEVVGGAQPGLYHNGTSALSRIRVLGDGELRVTGDGPVAMRCSAVSYNANIEVTDGGRLTVANGAGTAITFADREQPFGLAAVSVSDGGILQLAGTGGFAFDTAGSSGTCIFIEAGGHVLTVGEAPLFAAGDMTHMVFFPGAYLLTLTDAPPALPDSAPAAYRLIRPDVRDETGAAPDSYTLVGSYPYGFVYVDSAAYYPLLPGEIVTLMSEERLSVNIEIVPAFSAGGPYSLTLGPGEPEGFAPSALLVGLACLAGAAALILMLLMRKRT